MVFRWKNCIFAPTIDELLLKCIDIFNRYCY